ENCERENAFLVEVNAAKENDFLQSTYVQKHDTRPCIGEYACPVWIGANDIDTEGVFIWSKSKEKIAFSHWHPSEPSTHVPEQDCVTIVHEGLWDDTTCFSKIPFICEKEL
ncbi:low affinity immunoglobulin epsilon Fc receptor-like, partial [Saccostrea cucullata]|uniref:low affinity immunoglobulin epsilon Fc receptor-like n=1 Tax=Saccostrea cuccullata TaxID=36930 RepID=UPI002ED3D99C